MGPKVRDVQVGDCVWFNRFAGTGAGREKRRGWWFDAFTILNEDDLAVVFEEPKDAACAQKT